MQGRHKIFEALKNTPEGWRFCRAWNKEAKYPEDQYQTPFTLEQVLEKEGNGVGVLLGRHSKTTVNGKVYGLGAVDFDGTGSDINFKHHLGFDPANLTKTLEVASGKKDRKQLLYLIPEDYLDSLKKLEKSLDGCGKFELRIGNHYSMVAGVHPETSGYFWVNSPADTDIAIAPILLLEGWEELSKKKEKPRLQIKRTREQIAYDSSRVERYLERYYSPANEFSDYDSWIKVLMALHHLSREWEELTGIKDKHLKDAHLWSSWMGNYDGVELEKKWDSFSDNGNPVTIASFFYKAKSHPNWELDNKCLEDDKEPNGWDELLEALSILMDSEDEISRESPSLNFSDFRAKMKE